MASIRVLQSVGDASSTVYVSLGLSGLGRSWGPAGSAGILVGTTPPVAGAMG